MGEVSRQTEPRRSGGLRIHLLSDCFRRREVEGGVNGRDKQRMGTLIRIEPAFERAMAACLLVAAVAACGDSGPSGPSGPGTFRAEMISPHSADGAAVFELTGGVGLGDVTMSGGEVFYDRGPAGTQVIVLLDDPGQIRFQIRTENVGSLPSVTVVQVADGDNALRESLSGYHVQLVQVEEGGTP